MDKADEIAFALDASVENKFREEKERLVQRGKVEEAFSLNPPKTFSISFKFGDRQKNLPPSPGNVFEPSMQILLNAAEIAYWTKGPVSGEIETVNPASKWRLTSDDLKSALRLERMALTKNR